jgi:uncharacterized membrane protein
MISYTPVFCLSFMNVFSSFFKKTLYKMIEKITEFVKSQPANVKIIKYDYIID